MAKKTENVQEVIREIDAGNWHPIYFLMGEEPYYIDEISNCLLKVVLTESQQDFDQRILYGKDISVAQLINEARRYPMLGPYQLILVREAQAIRNFEEEFLLYVQQPMPSTILIINYKYKSIDKRRKLYSALEKSALLFESKKIYDNQVPAWITRYLSEQEIQVEAKRHKCWPIF
jgi:DNA polymerase-3 subunit delta